MSRKILFSLVPALIALQSASLIAATTIVVCVKAGTSVGVAWKTDSKSNSATFTDSDMDGKVRITLPDGVKDYSLCLVEPGSNKLVYSRHSLCLPGGSMNSYVPYKVPTLVWQGGDDVVVVWNVDGFLCSGQPNPFALGTIFPVANGTTSLTSFVTFRDGSSLAGLTPEAAVNQLMVPAILTGLPNFNGPIMVADDQKQAAEPPSSRAGFGSIDLEALDVEGTTGVAVNLGVQELNGSIWISGTASPTGPFEVWELDCGGNLLSQFTQPLIPGGAAQVAGWGFRDGATDGTSLCWGCEDGVYVVDTTGALVNTIIAANGPQVLTANPIAGVGLALLGNYRGLAFDPAGNGGNGSFWSANFGSALMEIDLSGNILTQHPQPPVPNAWSIYGLALDPLSNTIWASATPFAGDIVQIDRGTGLPTGARIPRTAAQGAAQGGMCGILGPAAPCVSDMSDPHFSLLSLAQMTPSQVTGYRVHLHSSVDGTREAVLEGDVDGAGFGIGTSTWTDGSTLSWRFNISNNPILATSADLIIATLSPTPAPNGYSFGIPEFHPRNLLSCPSGLALVLGDGFGIAPVFGIPVPLGPHTLGGPTAVLAMPPGAPFQTGDTLRMQALYIHPASSFGGLMASNELRFVYQAPPPAPTTITVSAEGADSFNANVTSGFFQVDHVGTDPNKAILKVVFDWSNSGSINPNNATMEFDVDQFGMADAFWFGNSPAGLCSGTYRAGSDLATGLIYGDTTINGVGSGWTTYGPNAGQGQDPINQVNCPGDCGFIATNQVGVTPDFKTIEWNYLPGAFLGQTFHVDVDTDLGAGINGAEMAGLEVTITLQDLTVVTGFLAVDPIVPQRSSVTFNP